MSSGEDKNLPETHIALQNFQSQPANVLTHASVSMPSDQGVILVEEYDAASQHPFSAFYSHPTTRTSFEQYKSESKTKIRVYERDLEAGSQAFSSTDIPRPTNDCASGIEKRQVAKKSLCAQQKKRRNPLRNLDQKQRFCVKILIGLVVLGAAAGIGIGISRAVGAGVWKNNNSQTKIPN